MLPDDQIGFDEVLVDVPVIAEPKPDTWYFGIPCSCGSFLFLSEDLFAGKGEDPFLQLPMTIKARCTCGLVTHSHHMQRAKSPLLY